MTASPVDLIVGKLEGVRRSGVGFVARCPAHDDRRASLKVDAGGDGRALLHCYAGCEPAAVVAALGLTLSDLYPPKEPTVRQNGHGRRIVASYPYRDERGGLLYEAIRFDPKGFAQRRPDGRGGWVWSLGGVCRVLYQLPELLSADPAEPVCLTEGEADADRLAALGFVATTNSAGAGQWRSEYGGALAGRRVVILEDNDDAGRKRTAEVGAALAGIAAEVRVLALPNLPEKGDVSDWLDAGGDAAALRRLIGDAPKWEPGAEGDSSKSSNANRPHAVAPPAFPVEVLPPAVRAYAEAAAASIPVPVEMVAVPLLGAAAALLGNRLHLTLKASYREYPSLYLALVAPPGAAKSPALKLGVWPLDVLQRRAMERHRNDLAIFEADLERWKAQKPEDRADKPTKPTLRHYFSSNLTLEALVAMLERSPGVAIVRDEILSWVRSMDQYRGGKGSDRQEFLSLWASATIKADRKGGEPIYRPCPVACVVGGIQPDFVADLHDEANRRDGFVERLLPVVLDLGAGRWTEATIAPERFADVLAVFEELDRLPPADHGGDPTAPVGVGVHLHPDARVAWTAWYDENAALAEAAPSLAGGFYRKLPAHVARFALILHALGNAADPRPTVSAERMADAIEVGEFFRAHVGRLLGLLGSVDPGRSAGLSGRVVRALRRHGDATGWLARSDLLRALGNVAAPDLDTTLASLLAAGTVEREALPGVTKPVERWRMGGADPDSNSNYSNYLDGADENPTPEPNPSPRGGSNNPGSGGESSNRDAGGGGDSSNSSNSSNGEVPKTDPPLGPSVRRMADDLAGFTDAELRDYRTELAAAPADDPPSAAEWAALDLAERTRAEVA